MSDKASSKGRLQALERRVAELERRQAAQSKEPARPARLSWWVRAYPFAYRNRDH